MSDIIDRGQSADQQTEADNTGAGRVWSSSRGVSEGCCWDPAHPSVLFLGSYLDETVLGICSSWMVPGSSSESGTALGVFPGTGLDATIFATV